MFFSFVYKAMTTERFFAFKTTKMTGSGINGKQILNRFTYFVQI